MGSTPSVVEQPPKFPLAPHTVDLWLATQRGLRMAEATDICGNYRKSTMVCCLKCYIFGRSPPLLNPHTIRKLGNEINYEIEAGLHLPDWTPDMVKWK